MCLYSHFQRRINGCPLTKIYVLALPRKKPACPEQKIWIDSFVFLVATHAIIILGIELQQHGEVITHKQLCHGTSIDQNTSALYAGSNTEHYIVVQSFQNNYCFPWRCVLTFLGCSSLSMCGSGFSCSCCTVRVMVAEHKIAWIHQSALSGRLYPFNFKVGNLFTLRMTCVDKKVDGRWDRGVLEDWVAGGVVCHEKYTARRCDIQICHENYITRRCDMSWEIHIQEVWYTDMSWEIHNQEAWYVMRNIQEAVWYVMRN